MVGISISGRQAGGIPRIDGVGGRSRADREPMCEKERGRESTARLSWIWRKLSNIMVLYVMDLWFKSKCKRVAAVEKYSLTWYKPGALKYLF